MSDNEPLQKVSDFHPVEIFYNSFIIIYLTNYRVEFVNDDIIEFKLCSNIVFKKLVHI